MSAKGMYPLKEIVDHNWAVQMPQCMYKLNGMHRTLGTSNPCSSNSREKVPGMDHAKSSQEVLNELASRQEGILRNVEKVRTQMDALRTVLNGKSKSMNGNSESKKGNSESKPNTRKPCQNSESKGGNSESKPKTQKPCENDVRFSKDVAEYLLDITINMNPDSPPYCLPPFLLLLLHKYGVSFRINLHQHSDVIELPECAHSFHEQLFKISSNDVESHCITLIWKNVPVHEFEWICNGHVFFGEVTFLRFVARLFEGSHLDDEDNNLIDDFLDLAENIACSKNKSKRSNFLKTIAKQLGKSRFILSEFSIVDIALYSAIKKAKVDKSELNVELTNWFKNCEAM